MTDIPVIDHNSDTFKTLRAAAYAGLSTSLVLLASQFAANTFVLDATVITALLVAFVNGAAVYIKNRWVD